MTTSLVPLRTGFDVAWLGYRRDQVQYFVRETELLAADRDAAEARAVSLARNLETARTENRALRARIEHLCREPLSPSSVDEHLRHAVESAMAQASAIADQASALEEHVWASARQAHAEHRDLLATTRERMSRLIRDAESRRRELDEAAAQHRARVTSDFELALAVRRKECLRDAQLVEVSARERAERMVEEAERQVEVLREHRDRVAGVLRTVHALLGRAARHLDAADGR